MINSHLLSSVKVAFIPAREVLSIVLDRKRNSNMSVAQKLEEQGLHQGFEKAMKAVEKLCNLKASLQRLSKRY